jgi:hypothetical protein
MRNGEVEGITKMKSKKQKENEGESYFTCPKLKQGNKQENSLAAGREDPAAAKLLVECGAVVHVRRNIGYALRSENFTAHAAAATSLEARSACLNERN